MFWDIDQRQTCKWGENFCCSLRGVEESVPSAATWRAGIYQTLFSASVFCFQARSKNPFSGLKIRWDVCHLTTLTVILPLGLVENKKNCELCLFPLEARCFLRPSLSYIKHCLSHVVRDLGQASYRNMASIGIGSRLGTQPVSLHHWFLRSE